MNKEDLRIIKTKKTIYDALLNSLKEDTFENLKVSDICNKALINRSTFYAHFNDKYDLLSAFINDMQETLTEELNKNTNYSTPKEYYIQVIKVLLNHIDEQKEIYKSILINNKNSIIVDMFYDTLDKDILSHLAQVSFISPDGIPNDIISKFYSSAVTNVCFEWLKTSHSYSKNEILGYLERLIP